MDDHIPVESGRHFNSLAMGQKLLSQLKQKGGIDSFEYFLTGYFSAEFGGFTLVRGDPEKLEKLDQNEDIVSLLHRSQLVMSNYRVVSGFAGDNLQSRMANWAKQVELLK